MLSPTCSWKFSLTLTPPTPTCLGLARARSLAPTTTTTTTSLVLVLPTPALRFTHDLVFVNGPISCHSIQIPVVCSAVQVQEAEYAGLFAAAKTGDVELSNVACRILHDLGYPQPPTLLLCDLR